MYDDLELGEFRVVPVGAELKFTPEMEAVIMELPIFKLMALGDSTVYAASKSQKEAKRKEANKTQKENVEKKKEAAPKKAAPTDPDQEMVKNPNPEGRDEKVTKEAADKWNRENGKGGAKEEQKPEKPEEPKKEEKPEDKHAEQVKQSGDAAQNILKDLGPKSDKPETKFDENLDFLKPDADEKNEKPKPEDELSEEDKAADEEKRERPSYEPGAKITRDERNQMKEAQEQHKKDHPDEYEDEEPKAPKKKKEEPSLQATEPEKTEEPKPEKEPKKETSEDPKKMSDEEVKRHTKLDKEAGYYGDEVDDDAPAESDKPKTKPKMTPEEHKAKAQKLVDSKEFEKMKPEDQATIKDFLKNPTPESAEKISKFLKSQEPKAEKGWGKRDDEYDLRNLTETKEGTNWFESLEEMYKEFKSELGV